MAWLDEAYESPKVKRSVGRPAENPFSSAESEEEFVRRGRLMLDRYYLEKGPSPKINFVFGTTLSLSKTSFWSYIFVYLADDLKILANNLQGFLTVVQRHFGTEVASDRTGISEKVGRLRALYVHCHYSFEITEGRNARAQRKSRQIYRYVVDSWKEVEMAQETLPKDSADPFYSCSITKVKVPDRAERER